MGADMDSFDLEVENWSQHLIDEEDWAEEHELDGAEQIVNSENLVESEEIITGEDVCPEQIIVKTKRTSKKLSQEEIDESEKQKIEKFYNEEHICCQNWKCVRLIPKAVVLKHREEIQELTPEQKELVILAQLQSHRRISELDSVYLERNSRSQRADLDHSEDSVKARQRLKYYFCDLEICRNMFLFLHDIGKKQFSNLVQHFKHQGLVNRVHKLKNVARIETETRKSINPADIEDVVRFITAYGEQHGMPVPGRLPNFHNFDVIKLPSDVTKKMVWLKYCELKNVKEIALTTFTKLWNKYCPYVTVMKPSTDLCNKLVKKSSNTCKRKMVQ